MKTQTAIIALAVALFAGATFADHNRTDEQGRKQGHWTEFPPEGISELDRLLAAEGEYVDGKKHGDWVFRFADGSVHEGPFVSGNKHGLWVSRFPNGNVLETEFVNDKQHGKWVWRFPNGGVEEGPWLRASGTANGFSDGPMAMWRKANMWLAKSMAIGFFDLPMAVCMRAPL